MKENKDIVEALDLVKKKGKKAAMATVVRIIGSAYRREGAKMLIDEDGNTTGLISGGCLEADVAITAQKFIEDGETLFKEYDMDEETVWGLGLGCPGIVQLYIEPITNLQPFKAWINCVQNDKSGVLATVLNDLGEKQSGQRLFFSGNGEKSGTLGNDMLDEQVAKLAQENLQRMVPESKVYQFDVERTSISVFIDVHVPPPEVMIFGAGHDAIPVAAFAQESGFRVKVVDQREAFANDELFPNTDIILARPEHLAEKVHLNERTLVVIMNHHIEKDRVCLHFALNSKAPYVGLLGPRKRRNRLLRELEEGDVTFSEQEMSRLYNPVGLDIGAEGSEEIAISIVSELIAFKQGKSGYSLRNQYDTEMVE